MCNSKRKSKLKQRNYLVAHVMRKGVIKHKDKRIQNKHKNKDIYYVE